MKAVIQRVSGAKVEVSGRIVSEIGAGIFTLLGVAPADSEEQVKKLISKIIELRIFEDDQGKMNRSLKEVQGEHLVVSQFTLLGDCSSGRRPSFTGAASPEKAKSLYEQAMQWSRHLGVPTQGGVFQDEMNITLTNCGPVTFVLEV